MRQNLVLASEEFEGLALGDVRLNERAALIAQEIAADPSASFPQSFSDSADLEAFYRFCSNDKAKFDALLAPHFAKTKERMKSESLVRVAHDTTTFVFNDEYARKGLGPINKRGSGQGFLGHMALAVSDDEVRDVFGVLGCKTFVRKAKSSDKTKKRGKESESVKWGDVVSSVRNQFETTDHLLHVMDREADCYDLLGELIERGDRFVIRHSTSRMLAESSMVEGKEIRKSKEFLATIETKCDRTTKLSRQSKKQTGKQRLYNPPRDARKAKLKMSATSVTVKRPGTASKESPETLTINIVRAFEPKPPDGEKPVEWHLLTTEPVETKHEIEMVVDHYRARWRIEEYFKAIKSGCSFEKRQLGSYKTLLVALGLTIPVAYTLLRMRNLGRAKSRMPANKILSTTEIAVLQEKAHTDVGHFPTIRQAMLAVASLGGHIKANGDPGWAVLARGYRKLLEFVEGIRIAQRIRTYDQ